MVGRHILITDFEGNPNIGAFGIATDSYCLVGQSLSQSVVQEIEESLRVPVHKISIAGTDLIGIFCVANNHKLLVPGITFDYEIKKLEKLGIDFEVIDSDLTALGNNILCNDNGAIMNPDYSEKEAKQIEKALNVKGERMKIGNAEVAGSCAAATNKACVIHREATEAEIKKIESILNVACDTGTVNLGVPFIKMAVINNNKGFIVSKSTTGPEINNIDQILFRGQNG